MTRASANRSWIGWTAAAAVVLAVEFLLFLVAVWLLRETVPCVWSGAEALGWSWHPGLLCLAHAGLFGRATWQLSILLAAVAAVGLVGSIGHGLWQLFRTRRAISSLLDDQVPVPPRVEEAAVTAGLDEVRVVDRDLLACFTHGLRDPQVIVSTGLVDLLTERQLEAALAHEAAHVYGRDPLRAWAAQLLAGLLVLVPTARELVEEARTRFELAADERAQQVSGKAALAGALHAVVTSGSGELEPRLATTGLDTMAARIGRLAGDHPARWHPSWARALTSAASVALVAVLLVSASPLIQRALHAAPVTTVPMEPREPDR